MESLVHSSKAAPVRSKKPSSRHPSGASNCSKIAIIIALKEVATMDCRQNAEAEFLTQSIEKWADEGGAAFDEMSADAS